MLLASRLLTSPFVSFYTFSGALLPSPAPMRLCAGSSFISIMRFLWDFPLQLFVFFVRLLAHCNYSRLIFLLRYLSLSLTNRVDRMQVWLFFLYICRHLFIRFPLSVEVKLHFHLFMRSLNRVMAFPHVTPSRTLSSLYLPMRHDLITSSFYSFGSVSKALGSSSSLLPSCLATASQIVLSPWHTLYEVRGPLAANHAVLLLLVVGSLR